MSAELKIAELLAKQPTDVLVDSAIALNLVTTREAIVASVALANELERRLPADEFAALMLLLEDELKEAG